MQINRIAIDLDGVVFNTIKKICQLYNEDFQYYVNYTEILPEYIRTWDFDEMVCASREYIDQYFCQPRFFENLDLMPCAKWIIRKLSDDFEINFVSSGRIPNLKLKEIWKQQFFPYARLIGVDIENHQDKSHIDLRDAIFIDDSANNLQTSNALYKICFGEVLPWNENWEGLRYQTWVEVYGGIKKIMKGGV